MQSEWSLLFSTRIHGLSFTSMLGKITNKGPTVIIVEDTKQNIFGGFASDGWRLGPKFFGKWTYFDVTETFPMSGVSTFTLIILSLVRVQEI